MLSTLTAVLFVSGLTGAVLSHDAYRAVSSLFLLGVGGYYLYNYFVRKQRGSAAACCAADGSRQPLLGKAGSAEEPRLRKPDGGAGDVASALALVSVTALSPCVGSMPVLLAVLAPPASAARAGLAGGAMLAASCAIMLPLVACAYAGASRLDFARIRRHERLVLGVAFVVLAAATFTVLADHDDDGHVHGGGMHGEVVRQGVEGVLGKKRGCH